MLFTLAQVACQVTTLTKHDQMLSPSQVNDLGMLLVHAAGRTKSEAFDGFFGRVRILTTSQRIPLEAGKGTRRH